MNDESKGFMKFIIFHDARIFYETHDASFFLVRFARGGVFSWINENLAFLKIVTRGLSILAVKRINFSFQSIVKNGRAGTVWTVHCVSVTDYQRKKSVITREKKAKLLCT